MAEYSKLVRELGEPDDSNDSSDDINAKEEIATVTFKLPKSTLERLNKRAKELGVTRSFLIRRGISDVLAGGSRSRISKLVMVSTFETYDENGVPIEHANVIRDNGENPRVARLVSELAQEVDKDDERED